jgi:hypothetical protein
VLRSAVGRFVASVSPVVAISLVTLLATLFRGGRVVIRIFGLFSIFVAPRDRYHQAGADFETGTWGQIVRFAKLVDSDLKPFGDPPQRLASDHDVGLLLGATGGRGSLQRQKLHDGKHDHREDDTEDTAQVTGHGRASRGAGRRGAPERRVRRQRGGSVGSFACGGGQERRERREERREFHGDAGTERASSTPVRYGREGSP